MPATPPDAILGVLAGGDLTLPLLAAWCASARALGGLIYAADGGADRVLACGHRPDTVVGDLDSLRASAADLHGIELLSSDDQDTTDAQKLLGLIAARGHANVTLVSLEGNRLDHVLGTLSAAAESPLAVSLALRTEWGRLLNAPARWPIEAPPGTSLGGTRLSVLPFPSATVTLTGVRWPLQAAVLTLPGPASLSNEITGPATIEIHEGRALALLAGTSPHW